MAKRRRNFRRGYRVIDSGLEKVIRELSCLTKAEYKESDYPEAMRSLPDFTVIDRDQKEKYLVEVRYRKDWNKKILIDLESRVKLFGNLILVLVIANPPFKESRNYPSEYMRCCNLRFENEKYQVQLSSRNLGNCGSRSFKWADINALPDDDQLWWKMTPLQYKFEGLNERKTDMTVSPAVHALAGILRQI